MDANASVSAALAAYRSGRAADARVIAEDVWRVSSDARAAGLLALLEIDASRFDEALVWNDRARIADPRDPRYALQGARIAALPAAHPSPSHRFAPPLPPPPPT